MRVALVLHRDFPTGGLQRDARAVASLLAARGHEAILVARDGEGEPPAGVARRLVPVPPGTNHGRDLAFARAYRATVADCDLVIGFDKLPGLDLYYAADVSYRATRGAWVRALPRGRARRALEAACVGPDSATRILALTAAQRDVYAAAWGTPAERFTLLPPIRDPLYRPPADWQAARAAARAGLGLSPDEPVALFIGRDAHLKGFDRVIAAMAAQGPRAPRLLAVGDGTEGFRAEAERRGLAGRILWQGGPSDVRHCFLAADLLLHPARRDNTAKVAAEALGYGLAVIISGTCGYAPLVSDSGAGLVLDEPFAQPDLDAALAHALRPGRLARWRGRARAAAPRLFAEDGIAATVAAIEGHRREAAPPAPAGGLRASRAGAGLLAGLGDPFAWAFATEGELKRGTAGRETLGLTLADQPVFLKRYRGVGWGEILKNWLQLKRPILDALTEWQRLGELALLGLPAPERLAAGRQGASPARRRSFLLMRALEGFALEDRIQEQPPVPPAERRRWARALGAYARRLHGAGLAHRDFYFCHWFQQPDGAVALLDWHRALKRRRLARRWLAKDLGALLASTRPYGVTRREVLAFLAAYHAAPPSLARRRHRTLWQAAVARAARLQARETRRLSR
jgi:UDP-glucose:(heptosyl)LPS alpha-1,3-glucosyltransferase